MATQILQRVERFVFGASAEERVERLQPAIKRLVEHRLEQAYDRLHVTDDGGDDAQAGSQRQK